MFWNVSHGFALPMTVRGKIVWRALWPSFTQFFFFPCPDLVYQAPVFKLNITPVLLRKLWWFNHCQWSYASRVWLAKQKGPSAVVRPAAKGLILWSKNCRLPHMFPINVECSVGLEEVFIMKWPSLHQTPWSLPASRIGHGCPFLGCAYSSSNVPTSHTSCQRFF